MITGKNYIGRTLSAKGNTTYKTINPDTNLENDPLFFEATDGEISEAVKLASIAFESYGQMEGQKKAAFLDAIAEEIEALGETLLNTYVMESGLPLGRANGERTRTIGQLRAFSALLREGSWIGAIINTGQGKPDIRRVLVPLGPVAVFGASNFPFAFSTAGGDTASALAAGCPVVVKSHPLHAGTGELVSSAIIKAAERTGMPNGVFSNLNSSGIAVGKSLVSHPLIKAVGFTGSIKGGTALCSIAAQREVPIPVYAEMGSINPVVVLPSALAKDKEGWAQKYATSITMGAGQFCTNPGLILGINGKDLDGFIELLETEIEKIGPSCMLHPSIKEQYEGSRTKAIEAKGVEAAPKSEMGPNYAVPYVLTISGSELQGNKTFHQEVFGPFSAVVKCDDLQQMTAIVNGLEGQLTGTILAEDIEELELYGDTIQALKNKVGRLLYNNVPTGVEVCSAMTHGGPFPASSDSKFTSVGSTAINRWVRPLSYQDWPNALLPKALQDVNPLDIMRTVNDQFTKNAL